MDPIGGEDPEAQYEYCHNIHIMRALRIVAIIGLVLNPLWAAYMLISSPIIPYDFALVALCLYALILVAVNKNNPRLLIPFLIFNGLIIGARLLYCFIVIVTISSQWFWDHWKHDHPGIDPRGEKVWLVIHLIVNMLKVVLNIWFEHVVYRAYLFMVNRNGSAVETTPLLGSPRDNNRFQVPQPNAY